MKKYSRKEDIKNNTWTSIIQNNIVNKNLRPQHLKKKSKIELRCEIHGIFSRNIESLYVSLNKRDTLGCPECNKIKLKRNI
jgi:hypothetical protein